MQTLVDLLNTIPAIDSAAMSRVQRYIDGLLKPSVVWEDWSRLPYNWRECRG